MHRLIKGANRTIDRIDDLWIKPAFGALRNNPKTRENIGHPKVEKWVRWFSRMYTLTTPARWTAGAMVGAYLATRPLEAEEVKTPQITAAETLPSEPDEKNPHPPGSDETPSRDSAVITRRMRSRSREVFKNGLLIS